MKASILDLRRRMREVLRALDRNEPVTILYRGKQKGILYPADGRRRAAGRVSQHPAVGMWRDRADLQDVAKVVRNLRQGRSHAL
jgi:antitoxin (DNA-binding transcriptional repressor) of toxin-antitoxin stability system